MTTLDHVAVAELLGLGTLASDLSGDGHLSTLGARLHNEAKDTRAGSADSQASEELVLERLSLDLGVEAARSDALSEELNTVLGEVESVTMLQ